MVVIYFKPKEGQDRDCNLSRETVFSYIRALAKARGEFSSKDVIGSFGHIYWCWNSECANIWRSLKFHRKQNQREYNDLLPEILNDKELLGRINKEIWELLSRWENEDTGIIIMLLSDPSSSKKDLLN